MRRYVIVCTALIGLASMVRAQDEVSPEVRQKSDSTISALRIVLKRNPRDTQATLGLANAYYDIEKWDTACGYYRAYLNDNPQDTNARCDYAWAVYASDTSNVAPSLRQLDTALAQNPRMFSALYNYGVLLLKQAGGRSQLSPSQNAEARRYFASALREARVSHPESIQMLESILYELEHHE